MKKYIMMLALLLALMGCKEEEAPATPDATPSETVSRTWKVQSVTVNGQADNTTDYSAYRFTFNPNQTYRFAIPDTQEGSWELIANATALTLDKGTAREQRVEVHTLTKTALHLEFTEESDKTGTQRILYELIP